MKKLIGAALILSLLGGSAAFAAPYNNDRGYSSQRHDNGNNNAVIAGVGILALAALFASQNSHDDYGYQGRYQNSYRNDHRDYRDYRSGYQDRGYDRGYNGQGYQDRQSGYGYQGR